MTQLIFVEHKPMEGKEHVPRDGAVIGREGADITIPDPEVSRRHATLHVEGDAVSIEDLGSTNGTFVNGTKIQARQQLAAGDEVQMGNTVWRVQQPAQQTAIAEAPAAAPPQVTAARPIPADGPPAGAQAPPPPAPPAPDPAQPAAQAPAAPPAPAPPAPAGNGAPAGRRGDVPAPDFQPSAIRRVVPPPGGPAAFRDAPARRRRRGSAATRLGATLFATIVVALAAAAVIAYYVVEPFENGGGGDADAVEEVIVTYATGFADGDGDAVCGVLTEDAQENLLSDAEGIDGGCEELVELAGRLFTDEQKDALRDVEPTDIEIDGDTATAIVEDVDSGEDETIELVREDGDWKISDPGN